MKKQIVRPVKRLSRRSGLLAGLVLLTGGLGLAAFAAPNSATEARYAFRSDLTGSQVAWTRPLKPEPETLRFAVIGDRTGLARPGVFEQAIKQVNWLQPEFLINVGDLLEGYTSDIATLADEWAHIEGAVNQLSVPFFYVAGNHDIGNQAMLDMWCERHGNPYYSFVYKDVLFLVLDTEDPPKDMPPAYAKMFREYAEKMKVDPVGTEKELAEQLTQVNQARMTDAERNTMSEIEKARFSKAQVDWARKTLKDNKDVRWTFVLMHKPAWTLNSSQFSDIENSLADRPYTVIAGHNHYYKHEKRLGRDYITMGTAGAIAHQEGPGHMDHIGWITVGEGEPDIAVLKLNGILDRNGDTGQALVR